MMKSNVKTYGMIALMAITIAATGCKKKKNVVARVAGFVPLQHSYLSNQTSDLNIFSVLESSAS